MTQLLFSGELGSAQIILEKHAELTFVGGRVFAGGPLLAAYEHGAWQLGMLRFDRVVCTGHIRVKFVGGNGPRAFGPFDALTVHGDSITTPQGLLARFDSHKAMWRFAEGSNRAVIPTHLHQPVPA